MRIKNNVELLDILDEDGNFTGEVRTRKEAHQLGLWHRTVHVWVNNSRGQLLIQQRAFDRETSPGKWDISAAGHISAGRDSQSSALMEVNEELGISLDPGEPEFLFTVKRPMRRVGDYNIQDFNDVYLVKKDIEVAAITLQEEEVAEILWIPFVRLEERVNANDPTLVEHPEEYQKLFALLHERYDAQ